MSPSLPAPVPQAILTPLTEAAIFLTLTVDEGAEDAARDVLADVGGLRRSVGFRIPRASSRASSASARPSGIGS